MNTEPLSDLILSIAAEFDRRAPATFFLIADRLAIACATRLAVAGKLQLMKLGNHIAVRVPQTTVAQAEAQTAMELDLLGRLLNPDPWKDAQRWLRLTDPTDVFNAVNLEATGRLVETRWVRDDFYARLRWPSDEQPE